MKQRIADALQIIGALALVVAAFRLGLVVGLVVLGVVLLLAGVVVERS